MTALRVAVLGGGRSSEHEVSLASAASVRDGLREGGHEPVEIEIGRDGVWRAGGDELSLTPGRGLPGVDVVFPVLHGPFGEDGTLQGLLESLDVPYVGAGVLASALCMDKVLFKDLMAHHGIPQVRYAAVRGDVELDGARALGLPAASADTIGITAAKRKDEPRPGVLATVRSPPISLARRLTMARPSPEPP